VGFSKRSEKFHVIVKGLKNPPPTDWDTVRAMLTDPKAPRRDAQGRDVFEVWADMVLANPATEYARVARDVPLTCRPAVFASACRVAPHSPILG
jgi:hypothetical protein